MEKGREVLKLFLTLAVFALVTVFCSGQCASVGETITCSDTNFEITTCFMPGAKCSNEDIGVQNCSDTAKRAFSVNSSSELREALLCSNEAPTELFEVSLENDISLYASWVPDGNSCLIIEGKVEVNGNGFMLRRIDNSGSNFCIHCNLLVAHVKEGAEVTFRNVSIQGGRYSVGANILNDGTLRMIQSSSMHGSTNSHGSGLYNRGKAFLEGCTMYRNLGPSNIFNVGNMTISDCSITIDDESSGAVNFYNEFPGIVVSRKIVIDAPIFSNGTWTNVMGTGNKIYGNNNPCNNELMFWSSVNGTSLVCDECPVGHRLDSTDRTDAGCIACDAGSYLDRLKNTCELCSRGTFNPDSAKEGVASCKTCTSGAYSLIGSDSCIDFSCFCYGNTSFKPAEDAGDSSCFDYLHNMYDGKLQLNQSCGAILSDSEHDVSTDWTLLRNCCDMRPIFEDTCSASFSLYGTDFNADRVAIPAKDPDFPHVYTSCLDAILERGSKPLTVDDALHLEFKNYDGVQDREFSRFIESTCCSGPKQSLDCFCPKDSSFLHNESFAGTTCLGFVYGMSPRANLTCEDRFRTDIQEPGERTSFIRGCCSPQPSVPDLSCTCKALIDTSPLPGFLNESVSGDLTCNEYLDGRLTKLNPSKRFATCSERTVDLPSSYCTSWYEFPDPSNPPCSVVVDKNECEEKSFDALIPCSSQISECAWIDGKCSVPVSFSEFFSENGNPFQFNESACSSSESEEQCWSTRFTTSGSICWSGGKPSRCHTLDGSECEAGRYSDPRSCSWVEPVLSETLLQSCCEAPYFVDQMSIGFCQDAGLDGYVQDGRRAILHEGSKLEWTCDDLTRNQDFNSFRNDWKSYVRSVTDACCTGNFTNPPSADQFCKRFSFKTPILDGRVNTTTGSTCLDIWDGKASGKGNIQTWNIQVEECCVGLAIPRDTSVVENGELWCKDFDSTYPIYNYVAIVTKDDGTTSLEFTCADAWNSYANNEVDINDETQPILDLVTKQCCSDSPEGTPSPTGSPTPKSGAGNLTLTLAPTGSTEISASKKLCALPAILISFFTVLSLSRTSLNSE